MINAPPLLIKKRFPDIKNELSPTTQDLFLAHGRYGTVFWDIRCANVGIVVRDGERKLSLIDGGFLTDSSDYESRRTTEGPKGFDRYGKSLQ